ncbi:MAG: hypothetical protein EXR75_03195 [Myxococcales bacterium]|nr:hypothetical protein [Myxococcales bacterium]
MVIASPARVLWLGVCVVAYLTIAVWQAAPEDLTTKLAIVAGPLVLLSGTWLARPPLVGFDPVDFRARAAARVVAIGAAIAVTAELGPSRPSFEIARSAGLATAGIAAVVALGFVSSPGGIAARVPSVRRDAPILIFLTWFIVGGLIFARTLAPELDPRGLVLDYASIAGSVATIGTTVVAAHRLYSERRFELGIAERASASLWLSVICLAIGVVAALMEAAKPERSLPAAALLSAIVVTTCVIVREPAHVARAMRLASAATLLGTPLMSVAVVVAFQSPSHAGLVLFVATALAVAAGLSAPRVAQALAPERGRRLDLLARALAAAKAPDPRQAVISALARIRDAIGVEAGKAAVYRFASGDRIIVDRADYPHFEPAPVPHGLVQLLEREPERVASVTALRSVEVHRPEVRPMLTWLDERQASAVALIMDNEVATGMLLWPRAGHERPLSYEDATALSSLAAHLGAATGAEAQLYRSQARELEAERARADASVAVRSLEQELGRHVTERRREIEALARRAKSCAYGPAAATAVLEVERHGAAARPFALVTSPGIDALAWVALAHLASPVKDGVLTAIDAALPSERALARWTDEAASPFALSQNGTLVVFAPHRLPSETQRYLASSLEEERAFIAVLPLATDTLVRAGQLEPALASRLGERSVVLPPLGDRSEDLRALALFELSRIGLATRGEPRGLSLEAQERLFLHDWPGNDAELTAVMWRAALATEGPVVTLAAVEAALGKSLAPVRPSVPAEPAHTPRVRP